jgi:hypothetical protein
MDALTESDMIEANWLTVFDRPQFSKIPREVSETSVWVAVVNSAKKRLERLEHEVCPSQLFQSREAI